MIKKTDIAKEKYLLFIDTETIGTLNVRESIMPFDIGLIVYDLENKRKVKRISYLVRKFFNNKYIMLSTFSATKYPIYLEKLTTDNKNYKTCSAKDISTHIEKLVNRYNIKIMVAHNGSFDKDAMARLFNEFGTDNPLENIDLLDTEEISKVITFSKEYADFCIENKELLNSLNESRFITNSGRVRITAQAIHSYLINNPHFEESHTALEDIDIEINIFEESLKRLGNTIVNLNVAPSWRDYSIVLEEEN